MKRVLITGGCGFVGRHFAQRLEGGDTELLLIDDLSSGVKPKEWRVPLREREGYSCWYGDIREWIREEDESDPFDLVIHCAAIVGGRLKIEGDPLAVATDLAIDSDFFNWVVKVKPKQVIYFSSSAVYPIKIQTKEFSVKLTETMTHFNGNKIGIPDFTYGWAKLTGEYLAKQAVERYGCDVKIYRPFSAATEKTKHLIIRSPPSYDVSCVETILLLSGDREIRFAISSTSTTSSTASSRPKTS